MLKILVAAQNLQHDAKKHMAELAKREDGAALIEYSILIGLISAVCITAITVISPWISGRWTTLVSALGLTMP